MLWKPRYALVVLFFLKLAYVLGTAWNTFEIVIYVVHRLLSGARTLLVVAPHSGH